MLAYAAREWPCIYNKYIRYNKNLNHQSIIIYNYIYTYNNLFLHKEPPKEAIA